ncbi:beige/beach-related [Anaeramoeba flamelloides]|uniref:Beige/beach-related n=1 Tax=Anaeramoeba flamelloides TaxID=1746091 RepID=A0AAV7Z4U3_9EUKA|nr:beige/beach-related [Anaeramoeba flamelloides]
MMFLEMGETIIAKYNCSMVKEMRVHDGLLLICQNNIYFISNYSVTIDDEIEEIIPISSAEKDFFTFDTSEDDENLFFSGENENEKKKKTITQKHKCTKISYQELNHANKINFLFLPTAIEIFSENGGNYFLNLNGGKKIRNQVYNLLNSMKNEYVISNIKDVNLDTSVLKKKLSAITKLWEENKISNFAYLMHLNTIAGRTYNDLTQYPVFPWILKDYTSEKLDLNDPNIYRDLSKPMGALNEKRLEKFVERYENWDDPTGKIPAFHYGSHYSSSGNVLYYLIRMEPFTKQFVQFQGGKFDHADRLFHSIALTYKSSSEENMSDVKELIPEFFYLPEFLKNDNNFNFGIKQSNGEKVDDVILPKWANNDAHEFIRIHRQALESDYVSEHLNEWIDLIFGYKQRGEEAIKANNVFYYLTYSGAIDLDQIEDPIERAAIISQINNFGQTPIQLFTKPHPIRRKLKLKSPPIYAFPKKIKFEKIKQCQYPIGDIGSLSHKLVYTAQINCKIFPSLTKQLCWNNFDHSLRIVSVDGEKIIKIYEFMHLCEITESQLSYDELILVTGGKDGTVNVWKIINNINQNNKKNINKSNEFTLIGRLIGHYQEITSIAISKQFNIIITGSKDKKCFVWDLNRLSLIRRLPKFKTPLISIKINEFTGEIITCSKTEFKIWTLNGFLLAETEINANTITSITMTNLPEYKNEHLYVTGHQNGEIYFWHLLHLQKKRKLKIDTIKKVSNFQISSLLITKDNKRFYLGDLNGNLYSFFLPDLGIKRHWMDDKDSQNCMKCGSTFTISLRRHHCRNCGKIFCKNCSSNKIEIPDLEFYHRVRACFDCFQMLKDEK